MLKTPLCDLIGIEKPVFQGGMAWIADASLASDLGRKRRHLLSNIERNIS